MNRDNLAFFVFLSFLSIAACKTADDGPAPNIILIMADDLGFGDLGCYGHQQIKTPNIDFLASKGLKFSDFHSNGAVCSPTRAALMTGQYQQRSGLEGVIYARGATRLEGLDTAAVTLAEIMSEAGYRTGIMGKWHLGYNEEYNPVYHGFDEFYGYRSGNVDYHSHYDNTGIFDWYHNLDTLHEEGYVTDLITRHSIDFIDETDGKPFFLYIAHEAPHVPFQGPDDPAYRFPDTDFTYFGPVEDRQRAYREMIEQMDKGIGDLMAYLEKEDLLKNTFIMFFSDNGGLEGYGDNGGLNGAKGSLYEGGHRVPGIAFWEDRILPGTSGEAILTMDIFPTVLSVCNIERSESLLLDGVDISPLLFGIQSLPERTVFWRYRKEKVARKGNMKMLITDNDTLLFDLKKDLFEQEDISEKNPEFERVLLKDLADWESEMAAYHQKTR